MHRYIPQLDTTNIFGQCLCFNSFFVPRIGISSFIVVGFFWYGRWSFYFLFVFGTAHVDNIGVVHEWSRKLVGKRCVRLWSYARRGGGILAYRYNGTTGRTQLTLSINIFCQQAKLKTQNSKRKKISLQLDSVPGLSSQHGCNFWTKAVRDYPKAVLESPYYT